MSLYKCNCGKYYTIPKEAKKLLSTVLPENKVVSFVLVCPNCGNKTVSGGEPDYVYCEEGGVMCFGFDYNKTRDTDLPHFKSVLLTETINGKHEFSTIDGSIYENSKIIYLKRTQKEKE